MRVFSLKTCDTCRKATKALNEAGQSYDLIDVRADGMTDDDIRTIVDAVGYEKALNRRSTTWRGLDDADKDDLNNDRAVQLISEHPTLLKRPAIVNGNTITVGWDKTAQTVWL